MASESTDPAAETNAATPGTGLQGTNVSTNDQDKAQRMALLEHFITFSISSGITSPGVLLEILHLADYDLTRATRIAQLVKQSPPEAPALITQTGNIELADPAVEDSTNATRTNDQDRFWNSVGSVEATAGNYTCSAAAASQYSVAVVGCGPNSAGVAVGTSAGTTTSTAVPLSAVTSLPSNTNLTVTTNSGAQLGLKATPNNGVISNDQNGNVALNQNQTPHQSQAVQQRPGVDKNNASIYGTPYDASNGPSTRVPRSNLPRRANPVAHHEGTGSGTATAPGAAPETAHAKVAFDAGLTPLQPFPNAGVNTISSTLKSRPQATPHTDSNDHNDHASRNSHASNTAPGIDSTTASTVPANSDVGISSDFNSNGISKLPPGVNPQMKLEDLFQYLKA